MAKVEYQKIELEGKIDVLFPLARNYHEGDDVDQDKKKALELYQKIELKGDKDDLFRLARMYHEGNVVDQDKKKALELYQKIELKGQISDLFNLAGIYSVGNNVDQDQKKALELYQKIELKGNREDLCYLARMYHEGHNVKQDLNKAIELYEKVGDNNAFFKLAEIYEHGEGVKDIKKAVGYLEKLAITRNHIDSIEKLKDFYLIDEESVVKNPSILLLIGENISKWGIKLNNKDSISKQKATLYEQAADLGHPKAAYLIGCAYKDGNGVDQDPEKAQLYLKKAVQLGSNEAKVELAKVELEGKTPDFNNIVTLLLGVNFKENDDLKAKVVNLLFNHQEELEENKTTIEQMDHVYFFLGYSRAHSNYNKEEAHSFFEKAVEIAEKKRNAALIGDIANIYLYGKGRLKKSHLKAETLYKKAKAASMRIEKAKSIEWDESSTRERFPQKAVFVQKDGKLTVTTDCSAAYLYQLESEVLKNVKPGDTLKFYSDIEGNAEGITLVVRDKKAQRSLLKTPIELQNGSNIYGFEIVVPENTGDISVLLYNSKITKSGTFTINDLTIEKIEKNVEKSWKLLPFTWDESPKRERFPKKAIFVKKDGKITITTDGTQAHLYQLESQNLEGVKRGGPLMLSYDIVGKAQGTTLVVRDKTNKRPLPKATFSLQDGYNVQDLQFVIPDKTGDISVLLFNEAPMESRTFTINDLKIERVEENVEKSWKLLPFKWDESPKRERFPQKATFIEKDGKITVNTDCSGAHLYQFESEALKDVKFGETIMLSYDIEGNAKGITLVVRDKTNKRPLPNAIFNLQNGYNVQDLQFVIPAGETSVLLYNSEKMENTTFTINSLEFKKVINNK
jgi:TPR repeat protein